MDFRELEYFVTIAHQKNLTSAASVLYVSQPALSKFLQRIEEEQGLPLFHRMGKQLQLTYAGERFLSYANDILALKKSLDQEMMDIRKMDVGLLHIGMPPFRCSVSLPAVLPKFRSVYPNVLVEVMDNYSTHLDEALLSGQIDLAFYNLSEFRNGLEYEIIKNEKYYAVFPPNHPIRERAIKNDYGPDGIYLTWLKDEILLVQDRAQRHGEYMYREMEEKEIPAKHLQRTSSVGAGLSLASNGYGVAFISGSLIKFYRNIYHFDYYDLLDVVRPVYFVAAWRKNRYLPAFAEKFIEILRENELGN